MLITSIIKIITIFYCNHHCDFIVNGVTNGIRLEKYCVEFAELSIHETELMERINKVSYI